MKRRIFVIAISILLTVLSLSIRQSLNKGQSNDFSGDWNWEGNNYDYTFNVELKQSGSKITGSHCAIALRGNRMDCSYPDEISLNGIIQNNVARINFESAYTLNKTGIATLRFISPDKIEWKTIKKINGHNYFPDEAILVRRSIGH